MKIAVGKNLDRNHVTLIAFHGKWKVTRLFFLLLLSATPPPQGKSCSPPPPYETLLIIGVIHKLAAQLVEAIRVHSIHEMRVRP